MKFSLKIFGPRLRQYWASITSCFGVAATAACFVWLTPLMVKLEKDDDAEIHITPSKMSWVVASVELGDLISPLPAAYLSDRWGRKPVMLSVGPLCLISWALIVFTRSVEVLYLVRVIQGLGVGIVYTVAPIYIAEVSEPKIRGELSGQFLTMWYIGVLYAYCLGPYLTYDGYAYVCAALPILFMITHMLAPESPYFYVMTQRFDDAEKSLKWLRAKDDVREELDSIRNSVEVEMKTKSVGALGAWKELVVDKASRRALLVVQLVCCVKYLLGMPAVIVYSTYTFAQSSAGIIGDDELTIAMGLLLCVSTFLAAYVVDWVGRRPLLLASTAGCLVFSSLVGTYYFLDGVLSIDVSQYVWVMYLSVAGYCVLWCIGLGPILQTIQAEYFPSTTRGIGGGLSAITGTVTTFLVLKLYQTVAEEFGVYANFWMYALFALIGTLVLSLVLRETAGKSLGQIQEDLKTGIKPVSEEIRINP